MAARRVQGATTGLSIPVLDATLFTQMMAANGIQPASGTGSILGTVTRNGQPVSGVTVTASPTSQFPPMFDGSTPTAFQLDETGERGVIWVPGVALGPTQLTFDDVATSGSTTVAGVRVIDGGITIMTAVLP